jgi:hypothetical protein
MSIEAMKMALDALGCAYPNDVFVDARAALRAAIAEAEKAEPVAWMHEQGNACFAGSISGIKGYHLPLYTHPAPIERCEPVAWLNKKIPHMAVLTKPADGGGWFPVFTHPAPVEKCEHIPVTTFGGDYCIKCDAPIEKAEPVGLFYSNGKSIWYQAHPPYQSGAVPLYAAPQDVDALLEKIDVFQQNLEMTTAAYIANPAPIPAGWKLVPVEPTEEMYMSLLDVKEVEDAREDMRNLWSAMLQAAPKGGMK